jgi:hypothetical protein
MDAEVSMAGMTDVEVFAMTEAPEVSNTDVGLLKRFA